MSKNQSKSNAFLLILLVILIVAVLAFGGYFVWKLEKDNNNNQANNNNTTINAQAGKENKEVSEDAKQVSTPVEEPVETKDSYINSCTAYTYKEIARNPNNYIGKRAKFTGEVIQVQEEDGIVAIRVNVTKDQYGYYSDTIMIGYQYKDSNESKILEDDIITVYGELKGNTSYTSVLGAEITLPLLMANYIDIK